MYNSPPKLKFLLIGVVCGVGQDALNPVGFDKWQGVKATGDTALRGAGSRGQGGDGEEGREPLEIILSPHLQGWTASACRV